MTSPPFWFGVMFGPFGQVIVTLTDATPPAVTANGALVPVQVTGFGPVVTAFIVTRSPVLAGKLWSTDGVELGSETLMTPTTSGITGPAGTGVPA